MDSSSNISASKLKPSAEVLSSRIDNEVVLMSSEAGFYYTLDTIGSCIWDMISENPVTLEEIVDRLIDEYEIDRKACMEDVRAFIDDMVSRKLILPSEY
jgi:hypothetical protein